MDQIAQAAGVSRLSVHRAINAQAGVGQRTRQRILSVSRRLGYRPNAAARAMRNGRFGCLSLLLSSGRYRSLLPQHLLEGIVSEAAAHDCNIMVSSLDEGVFGAAQQQLKTLRELASDGLLINYHTDVPRELEQWVRSHATPAVWLNTKRPVDSVYSDDLALGRLMTRRLLELGHRRVAYLDFHHDDQAPQAHYSVLDRGEGYARAMVEAGLRPQIVRRRTKDNPAERLRVTRDILAADSPPTALVLYTADDAGAVALAAATMGLSIPDDISVVAEWPEAIAPFGVPLTVGAHQRREMGEASVRMAMEKIEHPGRKLPSLAVAPVIIEGATTASPRPVAAGVQP
jgi:LacI family transcriptional regulator